MSEVSVMAWYRKYRPSKIEDYLGEGIRELVNNRFTKEGNRPSVLMIHGTRGCGKTTFCRIISKYYLCENKDEDGKPCEECDVCRSINDTLISGEAGIETPGVVEVDATTANGKEAIQNIIEDAIIPPVYTKKKILILDECHMITTQAQNSLLKIIEDIPEHLVVMFATTDPEKVIGTVHSRCQLKIEVKKQSVETMARRLAYIAEKEKLKVSMEALRIIVKKADRVPRESINLLESIAKNYGNEVTVENVRRSIDEVGVELYFNFFEVSNKSLADILVFIKKLKEQDISAKVFMGGLIQFTLDCLNIKYAVNLEDYSVDFAKVAKELFKKYTTDEMSVLLEVLEYASREMGYDESKGNLLLVNTAMRISKLDMLVDNLFGEVNLVAKENKQSMKNYKEMKKEEIEDINKKEREIENREDVMYAIFKGMEDVVDANDITLEVSEETEDIKDSNKIDSEAFSKMFDSF